MPSLFDTRSTWWIVTAYDKNCDLLVSYEQPNADRSSIPRAVRAIHGGVEKCPGTGRLHYQGAVECNGQQRAVFFRDWLPGVHFEPAKNSAAVKKYCLKEDTAVGEKLSISNPTPYLTMDKVMLLLGEKSIDYETDEEDYSVEYWFLVNIIIKEKPALISMFASATFKVAWVNTRRTWRALVLQARQTEEQSDEVCENKISGTSTNEYAPENDAPSSTCSQVQEEGNPPRRSEDDSRQ